jgi:hypothetical protein
LQRGDALFEMKDFPKSHSQIQHAQAGDRAAHPARSYHGLQPVHSALACRIQQKIIIAPVAEAQRALRNPWQQREHYANFKAQDDVEDNT